MGSIVALSLSESGRTYRVQLEPLSCECPGFQHRGCCYHVKAAAERFGTSLGIPNEPEPRSYVCYSCGAPWSPETGRVSSDGFHRCADVAACIAYRDGKRRAGAWEVL